MRKQSPKQRTHRMPSRLWCILVIGALLLAAAQLGSIVWAAAGLFPGEIPPDDFRISRMGPDGDTSYLAVDSAVVYNSQRSEFLVVWEGSLETSGGIPRETEIFGQLIDAGTGSLVGNMKRISFMGMDGDYRYNARRPALAYNPSRNDYLVVWEGNENTSVENIEEFEIWGQRLSYNLFGGLVLTGNELRISEMGPDGDAAYRPYRPAASYNAIEDRYTVVWESDDNAPPVVNDEYEIFGQEMEYTADILTESGSDFRISVMGPNGDPESDAVSPDIAFNEAKGEYLVVWSGNENPGQGDYEIWGRRILPGGSFSPQIKISQMNHAGENEYFAENPALVFNPDAGEWLVVWEGSRVLPVENEIYGQVLGYSSTGEITERGIDDLRISDMGPDRYPDYYAQHPDVSYDSNKGYYLVVWDGCDDTEYIPVCEREVFGQLVGGKSRREEGYNDIPLSNMGPDGDDEYAANNPSAAYSTKRGAFLIAWDGDEERGLLAKDENEIFGQRFESNLPLFLPLVYSE